MDYQLDLTAYHCPLPLLMAKKAAVLLQCGDRLQLTLNKQSSLSDFQLLACEMDLTLVSNVEENTYHKSNIDNQILILQK